MVDIDINEETKKLKIDILEHDEDFMCGQWNLNETLGKTEELYNKALTSGDATASKIIQDSGLLELQAKIARRIAKTVNVQSLVFNPREFSIKVRNKLCTRVADDENTTNRADPVHKVWYKLGGLSKDVMFTVPNFSFLYGTFDAAPIETVKKKRKQTVKDKIGDQTKPKTVSQDDASKPRDAMMNSADRIWAIFQKLVKKSETGALYFYDFVTDPQSFTRTVENIFIVSLLVKEGHLCLFSDEQKLPCLRVVQESEKNRWDVTQVQQSVLSLTMKEWENIVETFDFKTPQIPPKQAES